MRAGLGLAAATVAIGVAACAPPPAAPKPPTAANLSLNPTVLNFPDGSNHNMPDLGVTVTNTGGRTAQSLSWSTTNGVYSFPGNTCSGSLAPGQSCSVTVQFCPGMTTGGFPATFSVTAMDTGSGQTVSASEQMTGTGTGA